MANRKAPPAESDTPPEVPPAASENPLTVEAVEEPPAQPDPDPPPTDPRPVLFDAPPPLPPEADPARPPPPVAEARRGAGPIPLVLGGVVAAGLGFGLAQVVPQGWPLAGIETLQTRVAAQEAEARRLSEALASMPTDMPEAPDLAPLESALADLSARLGALEARPQPAPAPDLSAEIEALASRIAILESLPPGTGGEGGDPAGLAAVMRDLAALRAEVAAQQALQAGAAAEVVAAAEAARTALAEAEAEAQRLKAEAEASAQAALMRAAAGRVLAALDSGAPMVQALDELVAGGVAVSADLLAVADGAPTLLALQTDFPDAARAALDASLRAEMGDSALDRLGSFLRTTTGARSLTPRDGDDPDAILSRAEAALRDARLGPALDELAALPEAGRAALAGWEATARRRLAADTAARALAAEVGG
ncbi:MAG TPA: hypothetical protein PKD10_13285 [Paracoccaceae bacterium]|nr:hypothetical protein [Paracoccaceae bacterium]